MQTGFIGLGTMGLPMAQCLQKKGFEIRGWDINTTAMEQFTRNNTSIGQLAKENDTFITMLPEGEHVREVYQQILAASTNEPMLFIDCSTIDIETTQH